MNGQTALAIAPIIGGEGGGKPDNARDGVWETSKLDKDLDQVKSLLG